MTSFFKSPFVLFLCTLFSLGVQPVYGEDTNGIFRLVTNVGDLSEGDEIVIVNTEYKMIMGVQRTINRDAVSLEISDDGTFRNPGQGEVLELVGTQEGWRFCTSDKKFLYADGKDGYNYLKSKDSQDKYGKAKISINAENGEAEIIFQGGNISCYMRYNSTSEIFSCYKKLNEQKPVRIFKKVADTDASPIILGGNGDSDNNADAIKGAFDSGKPQTVKIERSFIGDGGWYTLCLPFSLTGEDIRTVFAGTKFFEFVSVNRDEKGNLSLNFSKAEETRAGVPYLIQPLMDERIDNPVFENKIIEVSGPLSVDHSCEDGASACSFVGVFDPTNIDGQNIRFVGANGTSLVTPNGDAAKLKGLRAYVRLPENVSVAKINPNAETSGIIAPGIDTKRCSGRIYKLNGVYAGDSIESLPSGIYIMNNKKIVK